MEMQPEKVILESPEKPGFQLVRKAIEESPDKIQEEFKKGGNDWFACLITRMTVIVMGLETARHYGEISDEEYGRFKVKLETLTEKVAELRAQRERQKTPWSELPPEEIREELIKGLDILSD